MPVVLRAHGLRFVIFVDDHPPPHLHVFGDGEAKITIGKDDEPPAMLWAESMTVAVQRRAQRAVAANQSMLLTKWA